MFKIATFAVAAGLSLAAFNANAATIDAGEIDVIGTYSGSDGTVSSGDSITLTMAMIGSATDDYADASNIDVSNFILALLSGDSNDGAYFTIDEDGTTLTFTLTDTVTATVNSDGTWTITGYLNVTGDGYEDSTASFTLTSSTTRSTGTYSLTIITPPANLSASVVPVPATAFLLVGGLGSLLVLRRRKRA